MGRIFDLLNPLEVRLWGANINRHTLANIQKAGLEIQMTKNLTFYGTMAKRLIAGPEYKKAVAGPMPAPRSPFVDTANIGSTVQLQTARIVSEQEATI